MKMAKLWKENKAFLIPYGFAFVATSFFLITKDKETIHLAINNHHSPLGDLLFKYITHLGDGFVTLLAVIILLFFTYRKTFTLLGPFLAGGLIVQVMKRFIFSDMDRPIRYFTDISVLNLVEGVTLHGANAFPSGHTASVFTLFFCLAVFLEKIWAKIAMLFIALLVAFSRVYLHQHFLEDVVAGSLLGVLVVAPFYHWIYLSEREWLNKSLGKLFQK